MPLEPLIIAAAWRAFPPAAWVLTFNPPLLGSIGPTDPTRWSMRQGLAFIAPTTATVTGAGQVDLENVVYTGNENRVQYLGPPPNLETTEQGVLQPFTRDLPL